MIVGNPLDSLGVTENLAAVTTTLYGTPASLTQTIFPSSGHSVLSRLFFFVILPSTGCLSQVYRSKVSIVTFLTTKNSAGGGALPFITCPEQA